MFFRPATLSVVALAIAIQLQLPGSAFGQQEIADQFLKRSHETLPYRLFVPEAQAKRPSFVVAPQVAGSWANRGNPLVRTREMERTIDLLDSLSTEFNIDQDRLYVTGLSFGGFGTLAAVFHYPHRFAAAIPLAGGFGDAPGLEPIAADTIGRTPFWMSHGEIDAVVPTKLSKLLVSAFEKRGRNVSHKGIDCSA